MGISSSPGAKLQIPFDHLGQTVHIECVTEGTFKGFGAPLLAGIDASAVAITVPSTEPGTEFAAGTASATAQGAPAWEDLCELEGQEDPMPMRASSSFSPDEAVAGSSASLLVLDNRTRQELLRRVAQNLGLQAEELSEETDPMVDILMPEGPSRVALPFIKTIHNTTKTLWRTPASILPMVKGMERKYFVPSKGYEYLFTHSQPGTLVMDAANAKERQDHQGPTPKSKEAKKLDLFGCKVYSTGGLQLQIANQQAFFSC
ncbi:uncharacterized protein LOC142071637 [Caretta caretta]|uniref:uncharacterized protein LOC142071637 n=1 Tax=Caretta caretta TaxID=8467 RepID=UPI003F4C2C59